MLLLSFNAIAADLTVFGESFTSDEYLTGPWYGPMDFSELPSLSAMGVERYDALRLPLDTARFDQVLEAIGFKKTGQIKKEMPVAIIMYSEQLLVDDPHVTFNADTVNVLSVYTLTSKKFGTTTHRLYEPKQSKLKPINQMTFKTLDLPECSTAYEFGLYWLAGEEAPTNATALIINNIEVGRQVDNGDKQFGDFRKILKKVKMMNYKGTKKQRSKKNDKHSFNSAQNMSSPIIKSNTHSALITPHCGNSHNCPIGEGSCNVLDFRCNGNGGGGSSWLTISEESNDTSVEAAMHDPMLYGIKFYLADSSESSLVIRAYDAWQHVQINASTIPLYFELIPALIGKYDLLNSRYSNGDSIVVDSSVKTLVQQVINHHRGYGDSNFQSHLDYLESKVNQYQQQTVEQVSTAMYPGVEDDPLTQ